MNLNNTSTQSAPNAEAKNLTDQSIVDENIVEDNDDKIADDNFNDDPQAILQLVCDAAEQQKAHDIVVLDVRGQTIVSDFFVICAGTSTTHINAIVEGIQDHLRLSAKRRAKSEGNADSLWMLLDYNDVVVHVFDQGTREFYDLERLWGEAAISRWPAE